MSFGYSAGDAILLAQLAWRTLQGTIKACGEYDELTREVSSLHKVLKRLTTELENPASLLNRPGDDRRQELQEIGDGCERILNVMDAILTKYNALAEDKRSGKRLWQKVRFGNGEVQDLSEIRLKLAAHTSAILMMVNLCSLGSQGRVEAQLNNVGGELEGIRGKVDWIAANMQARGGDGTVWTSYANDDRSMWKQLRSELNKEGYDSSVLHKHRRLIKKYVKELGDRGLFDQSEEEEPQEANTAMSPKGTGGTPEKELKVVDPLITSQSRLEREEEKYESRPHDVDSLRGKVLEGAAVVGAAKLGKNLSDRRQRRKEEGEYSPVAPDTLSRRHGRRRDSSSEDESNSETIDSTTVSISGFKDPIVQNISTERDPKLAPKATVTGAAVSTESTLLSQSDDTLTTDGLDIVQFKDAVCRQYSLPYHKVKSWDGMEKFIRQIFQHVENKAFVYNIKQGHYDLVQPNGVIILPQLWEDFVRPNWSIRMEMWPFGNLAKQSSQSVNTHMNRGSDQQAIPRAPRNRSESQPERNPSPSRKDAAPAIQLDESELDTETVRSATGPTLVSEEAILQNDSIVEKTTNSVVESQNNLSNDRVVPIPDLMKDVPGPDIEVLSESMNKERQKEGTLRPNSTPPLHSSDASAIDDFPVINFEDAVSRKFSFPFCKVETWPGMEELIKQCFLHVDVLGPHVNEGHYDLIGPDGTIIHPQFWEDLVRPNSSISMHMWPMPEMVPQSGIPLDQRSSSQQAIPNRRNSRERRRPLDLPPLNLGPGLFGATHHEQPDSRYVQGNDSSLRRYRTPEEQAAHDKRRVAYRAAKARLTESEIAAIDGPIPIDPPLLRSTRKDRQPPKGVLSWMVGVDIGKLARMSSKSAEKL